MRRRTLTPEQIAKRDERRARFKTLWKQVAAMPQAERVLMANKCGMVTCDGHPLSPSNTYLVLLQCPGATVLGGFRQWLKHGRAVRKGEHGAMIWVPCGAKKADDAPRPEGEPAGDNDSRFITGTIFDISQTEEVKPGQKFTPETPEATPAAPSAPAFTPEPAPVIEQPAEAPAAPEAAPAPQLSLF